MSLFVLSLLEIEDRNEVEVATGRNTKRPSTLNDIYLLFIFIFKRITKKIGHELIYFLLLQLQ
jgi:hypothetical protein